MNPTGGPSILQVVLAFAVVLGLLASFAAGLRYVAGRGMKMPGLARRGERLKLVETLALDARRRLVIVRCDNREHLVLLGHERDLVVARDVSSEAAP